MTFGNLARALIMGFTIVFAASSHGTAQEQVPGQQIVITQSDVETMMTTAELTDLRDLNRVLETIQTFGRSLPKGSVERADASRMFQRRKDERKQKFGSFLGLEGQSVMSYGVPRPSVSEILGIVLQERMIGSGSGMLHPHWERRRDGAIIGGSTAPTYETVEGESFPAGRTQELNIPIAESLDEVLRNTEDDACLFGVCN
ncbi:MAG: hypothetical protein ACTSX7_18820 [Alphaproteobacteria bacterium]